MDVTRSRDPDASRSSRGDTRRRRSANDEAGISTAPCRPRRRRTSTPLLDTMKRAAARAARGRDRVHARRRARDLGAGGPPTDHDVDLYLREADADRALEVLVDAGFRGERPPEDWLYKVWDGDNLVDLIFRPAGGAIDDEHFARATEHRGECAAPARRLDRRRPRDEAARASPSRSPTIRPILEIARCAPRAGRLDDVEAADEAVARSRARSSPSARGSDRRAAATRGMMLVSAVRR